MNFSFNFFFFPFSQSAAIIALIRLSGEENDIGKRGKIEGKSCSRHLGEFSGKIVEAYYMR